MPKKCKIFLDSSALISGLNSPTGGAGIIISAFLAGEVFICVSKQVIEEVQRNIYSKFPLLQESFFNFLLAQPNVISNPSIQEIQKAHQLIQTNDAPILAATIKAKPDYLITWNTKHFLRQAVIQNTSFVICTPKEFLQEHWNPI